MFDRGRKGLDEGRQVRSGCAREDGANEAWAVGVLWQVVERDRAGRGGLAPRAVRLVQEAILVLREQQRAGGEVGMVSESVAERKRREDRERKQRVADACPEWRRRAAQGAYAGLPGEDAGYAGASVLDMIVLHWDACPEAVRHEAVHLARVIQDGPDGTRDPRAAQGRGLASGPGH